MSSVRSALCVLRAALPCARPLINPSIARIETLNRRRLLTVARPDHVVVIIEEDRMALAIGDDAHALHQRDRRRRAGLLNNAHAPTHPSRPNYYMLISGSTQGVTDNDTINPQFTGPNLMQSLNNNPGTSFIGYAESLPSRWIDRSAGHRSDVRSQQSPRHLLSSVRSAVLVRQRRHRQDAGPTCTRNSASSRPPRTTRRCRRFPSSSRTCCTTRTGPTKRRTPTPAPTTPRFATTPTSGCKPTSPRTSPGPDE